MNLSILTNDELPRFEHEPGYNEECAKRFFELLTDSEAVGAVVEGGIDVDQPLDELTEEIEGLLEKAQAFKDLVEDLVKREYTARVEFYMSSERLDDRYFETMYSHLSYHSENFERYLQENDLPEELAYEIKEGIANAEIKGYWQISNYRAIDYNVVTFETLGYITEAPSLELRDALRHFSEEDFPAFLTKEKELNIDLSDHYPCYCVHPENIKKYLEDNYSEEYDRIRRKRA